jgi:hypothetical protein
MAVKTDGSKDRYVIHLIGGRCNLERKVVWFVPPREDQTPNFPTV